jgi:hypothetical protein
LGKNINWVASPPVAPRLLRQLAEDWEGREKDNRPAIKASAIAADNRIPVVREAGTILIFPDYPRLPGQLEMRATIDSCATLLAKQV